MTAPVVVAVLTCESISGREVMTLHRVRKRWPSPPRQLAVYLEVLNLSEAEFDVGLELWRGRECVFHTETELILSRKRFEEIAVNLELPSLEAKTHSVVLLLNGTPTTTIALDFGFPEQA